MSTAAATIRGAHGASWRERFYRFVFRMAEAFAVNCAMLGDMSILDHLEEFRRRIIRSLIFVAVGVFLCWTYIVPIIQFVSRPAHAAGIPIVAIDPTEIFSLYFKVAFAGGICLAAPFVLWQVWQFISPALHKHERRYAVPFLLSTTFCFLVGAAFGYGFLVPLALKISAAMAQDVNIPINMKASGYFDTLTMLVIAGGFVFEIPPVIFVLSRIGLVNARFLARNFRYAILISLIAAAILTPSPDAFNMMLLAIPIIALYGVGIVVAWAFGKPRESEA